MQVYDFWEDDCSHIAPAFGMAEDSEEIRQAVGNINNMGKVRIFGIMQNPYHRYLSCYRFGEYVLCRYHAYPSNGTGFFGM